MAGLLGWGSIMVMVKVFAYLILSYKLVIDKSVILPKINACLLKNYLGNFLPQQISYYWLTSHLWKSKGEVKILLGKESEIVKILLGKES